jgi:hypothetical protein
MRDIKKLLQDSLNQLLSSLSDEDQEVYRDWCDDPCYDLQIIDDPELCPVSEEDKDKFINTNKILYQIQEYQEAIWELEQLQKYKESHLAVTNTLKLIRDVFKEGED